MSAWTRITPYTERHTSGARVSASRGADGWRFAAWAPLAMPDASVRAWYEANCNVATRAPGDRTPQRVACLGVRDSAGEARGLVESLKFEA